MSVDPGEILGRYITDEHVRHSVMISRAIAHDERLAKYGSQRNSGLDVVHGRARGLVLALDDVVDRRLGEHRAGGGRGFGEDALGLGAEAAVEEFDDFEDRDLAGF